MEIGRASNATALSNFEGQFLRESCDPEPLTNPCRSANQVISRHLASISHASLDVLMSIRVPHRDCEPAHGLEQHLADPRGKWYASVVRFTAPVLK